MTTNVFLCNTASGRRNRSKRGRTLDYLGPDPQVRLGLADFLRSASGFPARILDLLEISAYIFAADRLVDRGSSSGVTFDSWSRHIRLSIRVRDLEFWSRPALQEALVSALHFLSSDEYEFAFQGGHQTPKAHLFDQEEFQLEFNEPHQIILFSGGLDSLSGVIERLETSSDVLCLVSHRSGLPATIRTQEGLFNALQNRYPGRVRPYRFRTGLAKQRAVDETQRTRSFLFGSVAFALAVASGTDTIFFYENGITSLNFSRREDQLNSRASRTTHPKALHLLGSFFSLVAGRPINVVNPYELRTKSQVLEIFKQFHQEDLIPSAVSCTRTSLDRGDRTHCGECLQCIDRRFAAIAADLQEFDHEQLYAFDIFASPLRAETKTVAIDYVRAALGFTTAHINAFYSERLAELSDAILDPSKEQQTVEALFTMFQHFGADIRRALDYLRRAEDLTRLPASDSLLQLISAREHLKAEPARLAEKLGSRLCAALPLTFQKHPPVNENDLNDKIEALIEHDRPDYRREFPASEFCLARSIPDHQVGGVVIETKYLRGRVSVSKVSDELVADAHKYPKDCFVAYVIYDPGRSIVDDERFRRDLETVRASQVFIIR